MTIAYCTLNGQPIPKDYGYTEEDYAYERYLEEEQFFFNQLKDYEKSIAKAYREQGEIVCKTCIWSDLYKDWCGCRPHGIPCPCKRAD